MFPGVSWKFLIVLKSPGLDTKASLITWLNSPGISADLLVVGMVGRKGPKVEPTLIGRTTDYALREAHTSSVICKLHEVPASSVFAVAVDGSERSHLGVSLVEHLVRPCDRVIIVHAEVRGAAAALDGMPCCLLLARLCLFLLCSTISTGPREGGWRPAAAQVGGDRRALLGALREPAAVVVREHRQARRQISLGRAAGVRAGAGERSSWG